MLGYTYHNALKYFSCFDTPASSLDYFFNFIVHKYISIFPNLGEELINNTTSERILKHCVQVDELYDRARGSTRPRILLPLESSIGNATKCNTCYILIL